MDVRHESHRLCGGIEMGLKFVEVAEYEVSRVFGNVRIDGKNHGDWLADIAYVVARKHPLPIGREIIKPHLAEIDRRQVVDITYGPDSNDTFERGRLFRLDTENSCEGNRRAHDAHVDLIRRVTVGNERARSEQKRSILNAR